MYAGLFNSQYMPTPNEFVVIMMPELLGFFVLALLFAHWLQVRSVRHACTRLFIHRIHPTGEVKQ